MSYGILKFKLPEEREEFELAHNAAQYAIALEEIDRYLRNRLKYEELNDEVYKAVADARQHLNALTKDLYEY